MATVKLDDRIAQILFSSDAIRARVTELGREISHDYAPGGWGRDPTARPPILICVLHGALIFMADLVREIPSEMEYDFICVASYGAGTSPSGTLRLVRDIERSIEGRDVLIVEDIIDTGHTIEHLKRLFGERRAASVRVCALIDKAVRREVKVDIDYTGFVLNEDHFIVGYGMDYAELYRNLPYIGVLKPAFIR